MSIVMAVDCGLVRTGVAVSDATQILASPVTVITAHQEQELLSQLLALIKTHGAQKIVVGYPKNMDGSIGERAQSCENIAAQLRDLSGLPVVLQDERLTTKSAHQALNTVNVRGKKRKAVVDAVAAVMILQDYLDAERMRNK